ncbi:hypothetical protein YC2023_038944 [Brassica napus]
MELLMIYAVVCNVCGRYCDSNRALYQRFVKRRAHSSAPCVRARAGAGGSLRCRFSLGFPLCASICCPIQYTFGSGLGFCSGKSSAYGDLQTAAIPFSLDSW